MSKPDSNENKGFSEDVEAQARSWVTYLHSGDATEEKLAEFETWLAADTCNVIAYHDYEQIMMDLGVPCGVLGEQETGPSVTPLSQESRRASGRFSPRALAGGVMAAAFALAATIGVSLHGRPATDPGLTVAEQQVFETAVAEVRDVTLPDGTVVTLGAKSRLGYKFEDGLRTAELLDGEAFFDVAKDEAHPFYVQAGDRLVRVVGTRFDVRETSDTVMVTVAEGIVQVMKGQDPQIAESQHQVLPKDVLTAGDQVVASIGSGQRRTGGVEPDSVASWREGWLAYEDVSLGDIIGDIRRYDRRAYDFSDPQLGQMRVTAAFGADRLDQFLFALEASYPLSVDMSDPAKVVFRPAD
ncbi:FecR family protein [Hyphomonas jannaschiana]|uniref:Sigma factor regulatory protein FecR/PupR family n=1 Tax=Hyphomonas jannaschiana VP2 TaxID=1280952 RepID=A0A059F9F7_9PROT|nr:FecR domain-containing protein [Hyphomonas jannaschiana]KCZ87237.1 sigma factor regulatory protein FecR/PupR family [Hyphomonas jannaschiana VP2]